MDLKLNGRRALVCGSSQGIGKAAAIELALLGASVTLLARNEASLKAVVGELNASDGQDHNYLIADFSKPDEVKAVVEEYAANNPIQILVNNTGEPPGGPISQAKAEEFNTAFTNHLINNHNIALAVLEGMKSSGYGRIINVISTSVKVPLGGLGVSNTVRGAVANWSKTMANELGQFGITVNNVLPGATGTGRLDSIIESKASKTGSSQDEIIVKMTDQIPLKRFAEPSEVGGVIAFLATPAAGYINGINVPVDGGRTGSL